MNKSNLKIIAIITGIAFILLSIIIAFFIACPSQFQYIIFRSSFTLGIAMLAGVLLTGEISIKYKFIFATGAFAVLVLFYLKNPEDLLDYKDCNDNALYIQGNVKDSITLQNITNVDIKIRGAGIIGNASGETDKSGDFKIEVSYKKGLEQKPLIIEFEKKNYKSKIINDTLKNLVYNYLNIKLSALSKIVSNTYNQTNNEELKVEKNCNIEIYLDWEETQQVSINDKIFSLKNGNHSKTKIFTVPKGTKGYLKIINGSLVYNIGNVNIEKDTFLTPRID